MADDSLDARLDAYFENRLTAESRAVLEAELRNDPAVRELFWQRARWHHTLKAWGRQHAGQVESADLLQPAPPPVRRRWLPWAAGLAAALVLGFWLARDLRPAPAAALATITYAEKAEWGEADPLHGTTMHAGDYHLTRGQIRFETRAGAVVSLAAPAHFTFDAADHIELFHGKLTARMLTEASTLAVKVADMQVRDLGTAFGIDANGTGRTLVSVFDGLVAVSSLLSGKEQLQLTEGQSVIDARGVSLAAERATFAPDAFTDLWPLTVGINEATRLVQFLPPGPLLRPLREYQANDRLFLFPEKQNAITDRALMVDASPAAPQWPDSPVSAYPLPAGLNANSYLLFFQPDVSSGSGSIRRLSGEITFQHRVLGVICSDQGLDSSDTSLGIESVDYRTLPGQRRGLEEADKINYRSANLPHDSIRLSPDGRTVFFDFYVADEREQMRVIVANE